MSSIEECVDDIDGCIAGLERYPQAVLAMALRIHLGGLLRAMVDHALCTPGDVRQFVLELEQEALGAGTD